MLRRIAFIGLAALAVTGCKNSDSKKSGPVVAKGDGFTITAGEFKARLDEQSPFMRARFNTLERKKEFLDNLVRFELLAREAEKQNLKNDPEVQNTIQKILVQKLVQKRFNDPGAAAAAVPDADVQKYFEEHTAEFHRPKRVRAAIAVFQAPAGPDRAKKLAAARKALSAVQADKKDPDAFRKMVIQSSEDAATKAAGGDMGLKTAEEIEAAYSKELAAAVFGLKQGEISEVIESPQTIYLAKITLVQEEVNRTLEQVKPQIVARLSRERKAKEFDEWLKKLKDSAGVKIDEKALEAVELTPVAAPGAALPGNHPMLPGSPGMTPSPAMTPAPQAPSAEVKPAGPAPASQQK